MHAKASIFAEVDKEAECFVQVNYVYTPSPCNGCLGPLVQSLVPSTKKGSQQTAFSFVERKTRLEPTLRVSISRELYLHPQPLKGEHWGRFVQASASNLTKRKKTAKSCLLRFVSGKRDSNSRPQPWQGCALPTELFPQMFYELATGFIRLRVQR